jgi:hypothetical protein
LAIDHGSLLSGVQAFVRDALTGMALQSQFNLIPPSSASEHKQAADR